MFCVAVPAFTMPMIMFSGLLYKRDSVPPYLAWLENVSIVNYSFSALLVQQVSKSDRNILCLLSSKTFPHFTYRRHPCSSGYYGCLVRDDPSGTHRLTLFCDCPYLLSQEAGLKDHMGKMMLGFLDIEPGSTLHSVMMLWILTATIALCNYLALSLRMRIFTTEL
jgi:hypothetical protein